MAREHEPQTQEFRLQPSPAVTGSVVDAAGRPVANAAVILACRSEPAIVLLRKAAVWGRDNNTGTADAAGRFSFPDPGEPFTLIAHAETGFAVDEFPADRHEVGALKLQPWATVRGRATADGVPRRAATVHLQSVRPDRPHYSVSLTATTDDGGRFTFGQVPPGPVVVRQDLNPWLNGREQAALSVPLTLQPGARAELELGGDGAKLTGKIDVAGLQALGVTPNYFKTYLVRHDERTDASALELAALKFDLRTHVDPSWPFGAEGGRFLSKLPHWAIGLAPDGTFSVDGLSPGEFELTVGTTLTNQRQVEAVAFASRRVTVTAADVARGEIVLPEIALRVSVMPTVGSTPALAFQRDDGRPGSLADLRGRRAVVYFWAGWNGAAVPAQLAELHDRLATLGVSVLGLSLDDSDATWRAALARAKPLGRQGRLDDASRDDAALTFLPQFWVLGPEGQLLAKLATVEMLNEYLKEWPK